MHAINFYANFSNNNKISYSWPFNFLPLPWPYRCIKFFIPDISFLKEATTRWIELFEIDNSRKRIPWSVIPRGKLKKYLVSKGIFLPRDRVQQLLDLNIYYNVKNKKKTKFIHILSNLKLKKNRIKSKIYKKINF